MRRAAATFAITGAFLSTALFCAKVSGDARSLLLPPGWRMPVASEVGAARLANAAGKGHLIVEGDFNGDGLVDRAVLLVRCEGRRFGLFAFLSSRSGQPKAYLLHEDSIELLRRIGIQLVKPGRYETACGKKYTDTCGHHNLPVIHLEHDAINYFQPESAEAYFYWDQATGKFDIVYISD